MSKKKKIPFGKIIIWLMLLSFILSALLPLVAKANQTITQSKENISLHEKQKMLSSISREKSYIATKLKEARLKEAYANDKLRSINQKLQSAQRAHSQNKKVLESNKTAYSKTQERLNEVNQQKIALESEAKKRLVAIYKQNHLRVLDGLINSTSVTDYLDNIYYQKRVMEYDKEVIGALIDQSQNIAKYKSMLLEEADRIQKINNRLQVLESQISQQKNAQRQVLVRLQNERLIFEESERQLERESVKLVYKITELSGGAERGDNPNATGNFIYPVNARISSPFGPRRHPIFGVRSMHSGIDLAAPRGTPIKSSEGGVVIYSGWYGGYGKVVIVDHSKGFSTLYAHLDKIAVSVGEKLRQGDVVGYEGATGYATGPHLHFEVRQQGKPQNPMFYLRGA
jgi:murein DD-endopeptidase MepM/ murein hydrolase activator NlpD